MADGEDLAALCPGRSGAGGEECGDGGLSQVDQTEKKNGRRKEEEEADCGPPADMASAVRCWVRAAYANT